MTPVSPKLEEDEVIASVENDPGVKEEFEEDAAPIIRRMGGVSRQSKPKTQSTSARRKYIRREGSAMVDEAAFRDFDYRMDVSDYTPERCEELERTYWRDAHIRAPCTVPTSREPSSMSPQRCGISTSYPTFWMCWEQKCPGSIPLTSTWACGKRHSPGIWRTSISTA